MVSYGPYNSGQDERPYAGSGAAILRDDHQDWPSEPSIASTVENPAMLVMTGRWWGHLPAVDFILKTGHAVEMARKDKTIRDRLPLDCIAFRNAPIFADGSPLIRYHASVQIEIQVGRRRFKCDDSGLIVIQHMNYRRFRRHFLAVCEEYGIEYDLPVPPGWWIW